MELRENDGDIFGRMLLIGRWTRTIVINKKIPLGKEAGHVSDSIELTQRVLVWMVNQNKEVKMSV